ncbi:probable serine/threonine-protein kinase PBL11 [Beta vulgaris subsp. vulgaris]|uniref:probable serine/threonine-protein kinase PBL11 n=1 Tax=Beta vulgaris subsp. vulgaris TaxID=3555 RepID=UPI002036E232|nr:probable serine/threonine-protein kinase PBL11 [Beta vulgaris subsp. vulgaris]XP_010683513.2 probable serine/threonine-protein kinase PBL11 [Beta vulgaris subsp. vulgaris]XP_048504057.1 probable serine/threonine-protein kinase PBL11 [Beta vulgaris subsp. vulgaris]
MGCFTVLKGKKKKTEKSVHIKRVLPQESTPTTLPEPQIGSHALQSAPPSFRTRGQPVQPTNKLTYNRMRALSAPSSLHGPDRESSSIEYEEREELKSHVQLPQEQRSPSPQPLPLPSPHGFGSFKSTGSFKAGSSSGPLNASGPLPLPPSGSLRNFSYEEISSACHNISSETCTSESLSSINFKASFCDVSSSARKIEATVTRFYPSAQGLREFMNEVNTLASLQHPNLCKLLGYHAREGSDQRILVYERLHHGSLDQLLYGRSAGPPIDWNTRVKVALCAAQGLTFLHEQGPFQAMYNEFSTVNIQIDKDFSAKLSGYGCIGLLPEADLSNASPALGNLSVETMEKGILTPKSNVYSFGIVLLEVLTGRKNMDSRRSKEERNLVKWSWPFLADECRLSLIMDPQLKGRFPIKAARTVADIAQKCLQKDPSERPTMRIIVENLKTIQDIKHSCRFPLQEPGTVAGKQMFRSPSLPPRQSYSHPSPSQAYASPISPTRPLTLPLSLPPRACSSLVSLDELELQEARKSSSSSAVYRRSSVEGF